MKISPPFILIRSRHAYRFYSFSLPSPGRSVGKWGGGGGGEWGGLTPNNFDKHVWSAVRLFVLLFEGVFEDVQTCSFYFDKG